MVQRTIGEEIRHEEGYRGSKRDRLMAQRVLVASCIIECSMKLRPWDIWCFENLSDKNIKNMGSLLAGCYSFYDEYLLW
jgi:hypothetical protein